MTDFESRMKEKLLQEALHKRILSLMRSTLKEFHTIYSEEFTRYQIERIDGFHPAIKHFNETFLFLQFIEGLSMSYKNCVYHSMKATQDVMSDPMKFMELMTNPDFMHFVKEFQARTNRDIN